MFGLNNLRGEAAKVVAELAARFHEAGFELNLVGGTVRDLLDGREPGDVDLCTNATPDEFEPLIADLGTVYAAGRLFGTLAVSFGESEADKVEITSYRTEGYSDDSRKPEVVFTSSLEEDLSRRDFTVNAMAFDVIAGKLIDPFGGGEALKRGELATPGDPVEIMMDDPLRSVRAVRFAAVRGWTLVPELVEAIRVTRERLVIVSRERITAELGKMLAADNASARTIARAVEVARSCGIAEDIFDAFTPGEDAPLELVSGESEESCLFTMAAISGLSPAEAEAAGRRMKLPVAAIRGVSARLRAFGELSEISNMAQARAYLRRHQAVHTDVVAFSERLGNSSEAVRMVRAALGEPNVFGALPVNGDDLVALGLKEGPLVGQLLRQLEDLFCQQGSLNREEALAYARSALHS